jgi:hypothetical protein
LSSSSTAGFASPSQPLSSVASPSPTRKSRGRSLTPAPHRRSKSSSNKSSKASRAKGGGVGMHPPSYDVPRTDGGRRADNDVVKRGVAAALDMTRVPVGGHAKKPATLPAINALAADGAADGAAAAGGGTDYSLVDADTLAFRNFVLDGAKHDASEYDVPADGCVKPDVLIVDGYPVNRFHAMLSTSGKGLSASMLYDIMLVGSLRAVGLRTGASTWTGGSATGGRTRSPT